MKFQPADAAILRHLIEDNRHSAVRVATLERCLQAVEAAAPPAAPTWPTPATVLPPVGRTVLAHVQAGTALVYLQMKVDVQRGEPVWLFKSDAGLWKLLPEAAGLRVVAWEPD